MPKSPTEILTAILEKPRDIENVRALVAPDALAKAAGTP